MQRPVRHPGIPNRGIRADSAIGQSCFRNAYAISVMWRRSEPQHPPNTFSQGMRSVARDTGARVRADFRNRAPELNRVRHDCAERHWRGCCGFTCPWRVPQNRSEVVGMSTIDHEVSGIAISCLIDPRDCFGQALAVRQGAVGFYGERDDDGQSGRARGPHQADGFVGLVEG